MFRNEKGLSLMELLAGIVLLSIVTTLTTIILINIFDREETSAKAITLKQDTNVMISKLRKEFFDNEDKQICFDNQGGKLLIDSKTIVTNGNGSIKHDGDSTCLSNFSREKPVKLEVYVRNSKDKKLHIRTVLEKGGANLTFSDIDPCELDWKAAKKVEVLPCQSEGNTIWIGDKSACTKSVIKGNLKVDHALDGDSLKNKSLEVTKNACFLKSIQPEKATLDIKGNASFYDSLKPKSTIIEIGNKARIKGETEFTEDAQLVVEGSADFLSKDNQPHFYGESTFKIIGNAFFAEGLQTQAPKLEPNKSMTIGGYAFFDGPLQLENYTDLSINGISIYKETVSLQNSSNLILEERAKFHNDVELKASYLTVNKGLDFLNGKFHVGGSSTFNSPSSNKADFTGGSLHISDNTTFCAKNLSVGKSQGKINPEKCKHLK